MIVATIIAAAAYLKLESNRDLFRFISYDVGGTAGDQQALFANKITLEVLDLVRNILKAYMVFRANRFRDQIEAIL